METPKRLLTPPEAADLINVKTNTLAIWRVEGKGPRFIKLGHAVRYNEADVLAWIQTRMRTSTSQHTVVTDFSKTAIA